MSAPTIIAASTLAVLPRFVKIAVRNTPIIPAYAKHMIPVAKSTRLSPLLCCITAVTIAKPVRIAPIRITILRDEVSWSALPSIECPFSFLIGR